MKRVALVIPAIVLLVSCAAEDPPVAQTEASTVETTQTSPSSETPTTAAHGEEPVAEEHNRDVRQEETSEEDHGAEAEHADEVRTIEVTMSEFSFEPSSIEISAGETVTFMIQNIGLIDHEFRLSNTHRIEEHIASGHADHEDGAEVGHHEEGGDVVVLVAAGDSAELTFQFPEDATIYTNVACLIPGHHEAGMVADLNTTG